MVTLAFFQPSGTQKYQKKSNVCLSMLFFMLVLVGGAIMLCGIWYENGTHIVLTYVSQASHLGCIQYSASIHCILYIIKGDCS
jgi:hypothetical protein